MFQRVQMCSEGLFYGVVEQVTIHRPVAGYNHRLSMPEYQGVLIPGVQAVVVGSKPFLAFRASGDIQSVFPEPCACYSDPARFSCSWVMCVHFLLSMTLFWLTILFTRYIQCTSGKGISELSKNSPSNESTAQGVLW